VATPTDLPDTIAENVVLSFEQGYHSIAGSPERTPWQYAQDRDTFKALLLGSVERNYFKLTDRKVAKAQEKAEEHGRLVGQIGDRVPLWQILAEKKKVVCGQLLSEDSPVSILGLVCEF
jgi:hypothetical protein